MHFLTNSVSFSSIAMTGDVVWGWDIGFFMEADKKRLHS
jgi:hypothetical protein